MANRKKNPVKYGKVIAKCWEDEAYKKRFLEDPEGVLTEAGFVVEEGVTYKVIEQPKLIEYLVLPHAETKDAVQELSKRLLNRVEKRNHVIPEGMEVRIVQNTDDIRYIVLPASPKSLTQAELKMVAGGDSAETETNVVHQAEVVDMSAEAVVDVTTAAVDAEVAVALVVVVI